MTHTHNHCDYFSSTINWNFRQPLPSVLRVFLISSTTRKFHCLTDLLPNLDKFFTYRQAWGGSYFFRQGIDIWHPFGRRCQQNTIVITFLLIMCIFSWHKPTGYIQDPSQAFLECIFTQLWFFFKRLPYECCMRPKRERQGWYSSFFSFFSA